MERWQRLSAKLLDAKLHRMGLNDCFAESGDEFELLDKYRLSAAAIVKNIENIIKQKNKNSQI